MVLGFSPSAAMSILQINHGMRLRLMRQPSPLRIAIIGRESGSGQAVNSWSNSPYQLNIVVIGRPRRR